MKIEFKKQYGKGTDPWYAKAERWVYKKFKNPFIQHLAIGFIEWLKEKWVDIKIENTMTDVDRQVKEIKEQWDEEERKQFAPEYTETPSEVEGLNDMSISLPSREEDPS
jgi:hypothetical protein